MEITFTLDSGNQLKVTHFKLHYPFNIARIQNVKSKIVVNDTSVNCTSTFSPINNGNSFEKCVIWYARKIDFSNIIGPSYSQLLLDLKYSIYWNGYSKKGTAGEYLKSEGLRFNKEFQFSELKKLPPPQLSFPPLQTKRSTLKLIYPQPFTKIIHGNQTFKMLDRDVEFDAIETLDQKNMFIQRASGGWITSYAPMKSTGHLQHYLNPFPFDPSTEANSSGDAQPLNRSTYMFHFSKKIFGFHEYKLQKGGIQTLYFYPQFKELPSCFFKNLKEIQDELVFFIDYNYPGDGVAMSPYLDKAKTGGDGSSQLKLLIDLKYED